MTLAVKSFVGCLALVTAALWCAPSEAAPSQRLVRSFPHKLQSVEPPLGWELGTSPPSSRLVATWSHRDGGRLTLASEAAAAGVDATQLFAASRSSLERQGWTLGQTTRGAGHTPGSSRIVVEASLDKGKRFARQLYLIEGGFAYVLTMVGPAEQSAPRQREFDETLASLRLGGDDN